MFSMIIHNNRGIFKDKNFRRSRKRAKFALRNECVIHIYSNNDYNKQIINN